MANLGLKNILADCLARVLTEKKARLPIGQVELGYMQSFFDEVKLAPEERERALNCRQVWIHGNPSVQLQDYKESLPPPRGPIGLLSTEAITAIAKANPIAQLIFQPRAQAGSTEVQKRNKMLLARRFYINALTPHYVEGYLKQYTDPEELLAAYVRAKVPNPQIVYEYDPNTDLIEAKNPTTGIILERFNREVITDNLASLHFEKELPRELKGLALASAKIQKEIGGPAVEQKYLVDEASRTNTWEDQSFFLHSLGLGEVFSEGYTRPHIPGTIPHADFVKFFASTDQTHLQHVLTDTGLLEKFYSYVFNQFTLEQLKDYRQALIAQGVDVNECSDEYIEEYRTYLQELFLQEELGAAAMAPEVLGFL